jgi:ADP-ribose pyrophosphatase YjhB (NUDIX family)
MASLMISDLAAFLADYVPQTEETAVWGAGTIPLHLNAYLGQTQPPLPYVTSARCLVFRKDAVLVLRNRDSIHIVPGGRREVGEQLEDTIRREVLQEAGWTLHRPVMLGFMWFHHLGPRPPGHPYPYPDFIQVVYMAEAADYWPNATLSDDYELEAGFLPLATVQSLVLTPSERLYLAVALDLRAR